MNSRGKIRAIHGIPATVLVCIVAGGCARYHPAPISPSALSKGAMTQEREGVRVSVVVPADDEVERLFGVPLTKYGIQPVGVDIENGTQGFYWFAPLALDPDYFTPLEAANRARYRFFRESANESMREHFLASAIGSYVGPGQRIGGFVFTNLSRGLKPVNVDLIAPHRMLAFYFTIVVPNLDAEYSDVDLEHLYKPDEIRDVTEAELRAAIEAMPCCATTEEGGSEDPLNFVVLGDPGKALSSFVRTGWHVSEVLRARSALATFWSYFFSSSYKYAPVSPLYLFGRRQDLALQKARETARERNHLRIWRAPLRCNGAPVWIGQISRDVGLTFSWKTFVGHEVDPDVDEARNYLVQDMLRSQGLQRFGWVKGVGAAPPSDPRHMDDGSPYFTDGLRLVLWFGQAPISLDQITFLNWERLAPR